MAQKRPFGAGLNFYDGQWILPSALLALSTLYWDIGWTKVVMLVLFAVYCFHINYEHRIVFGKKDLNMRRLYNLAAYVASYFVIFIMPVYVLLSYAIFASKLKKDKQEQAFSIKKMTYFWMMIILVLVVLIHTVQGLAQVGHMKEVLSQRQETAVNSGLPGTIRQ